MSLVDANHPLGEQIRAITGALDLGLADSKYVPDELELEYASPLETTDGSAVLTFIDTVTENLGALIVPVLCDGSDAHYTVKDRDGTRLTEARVKLMDFKSRNFPISIGDDERPSTYIQFDITTEGIIFSARPDELYVSSYALFESDLYYYWFDKAREQASIDKLHDAALRFLAEAA